MYSAACKTVGFAVGAVIRTFFGPVPENAKPDLQFLWKSCELGSLTALQQNRYVKKVSRTAEFIYVDRLD
jgi:hypothetical protein